jgi:copper(I)-binding protein
VKRSLVLTALSLAALTLVGCAATAVTPGPVVAGEARLPTASDVWVKAVPELMDGTGMTGLFGVFENSTDEDISIVGGTTDPALTLTPLETHEVLSNSAGEMVMQKVAGGIVIPAHGSVTLSPGGYHVMFLDLLRPIAVGEDVSATITFSNGTTLDVTAVSRDISNAQESYNPHTDTGATPMPTMNMG